MQVRKLPRDTGLSGWNEVLPKAPPPRRLERGQHADWLVIGAGFAGLAAARRLAQIAGGDRIVVLEAARLAEGPAGRNSGFMIDLPHELNASSYAGAIDADRRQIELNRAAIAFARDAAREHGLDHSVFDPSGKINAAAGAVGERHNRSYAAHLERLGETFRFLDAGSMREITGTDYYTSGLYNPGAAIIQPAAFVRGIAAGLQPGVDLFEQSPVTALDRRGGVWRAVSRGASVEAPRVILAVNGHAESFGFYIRRLMHVFTYASMTRALSPGEVAGLGGEPVWSLTPADPMGTTVRRIAGAGGDRIVIRNRFTYDPSMEIPDRRLVSVGRVHDASFRARFPMLKDVSMEYRWGGRLCLSLNSVPAFGEVDENLYSACCQNGLGTVKGTLSGMLAAELATGRRGTMVQAMLDADRPRKLPPEPFARVGINAAMKWKEHRAGAEL